MSVSFTDTEDVFAYMQLNLVQATFRGEPQLFLKKSAFDIITTKQNIRLVIDEEDSLYLNEEELDTLVDQVARKGKKLFATCVQGCIPMTCLKLLLEKGLTDADMPLTKDHCPGNSPKRNFVSSFIPNQALFNTAYFELDGYQDLKGLTKPIEHDENKLIGRGAFGSVYEVHVHPGYSSFADSNCVQEFAMKVTQQQESRELPYHQAMVDLSHPQLVKCLTSFTFASQYHMIYEKASSNLEHLMTVHKAASALRSLSPQDLAQQFAGLIGAVSVIHNQLPLEADASRLGVPKFNPGDQRSGYLHDVKTENILVFLYDERPWLRLSDFSCARVVEFVSSVSGLHRESWRTTNKASTPVYRAPEFTIEGKTSRPYDIWSFGCVLIEVLVWYFEGVEALTSFRNSRRRLVKPGGIEDEGFYYIDGRGNPRLREQVEDRLNSVTQLCEGSLRVVAKAIPEMLEIDSKKRPTAQQLVDRFKSIGQPSLPRSPLRSTSTSNASQARRSMPSSLMYDSEPNSAVQPMISITVRGPTDK